MQEWTGEVGIQKDFIPFFFHYVFSNFKTWSTVFTIVEFEFFDIFYFKFQLVLTFSICSKFCVENCFFVFFFFCDLSCK